MTLEMKACPDCGVPVPEDARNGFCPKCLFARAGGFLDTVAHQTQMTVPELGSREEGFSGNDSSVLRTFGDYELIEEVARGGMGVVYKARQLSLDRIVAVKMILAGATASKEFIHRFRTEAAAAANLQHPNIVAVHEVGAHQGENYLVMDFVDGPNLAHFVGQQPLPAHQAARYVKLISEAIHHAHERGILHRDLKPSNVLIDSATDQPRVTDFGLAKRIANSELATQSTELTLTGQVLGSPNFMAPEQAAGTKGKVSRRADVYGLGAILYDLLTARPLFQAESLPETLKQVAETEPLSPRLLNPRVPRDLETICLKCLEKKPEKRYATGKEVADELTRFLNHEPIQARPVTRAERAWRWCHRKPALAATLAVLQVVLIVGLSGIVWQWRRAEQGEAKARQNLYAADMLLAQQALEQSEVRRLTELLQKHVPRGREKDLRGWEWRYLRQFLRSDDLGTLGRHSRGVESVAIAPDGMLIASGGNDGMRLWDVRLRRELPLQGAAISNRVSSVAFSPDGNWLASAEAGRAVRIWAVKTTHQAAPTVLQSRGAGRLAWSPDSRLLVNVVWGDRAEKGSSRFRVWDVLTRQEFARGDLAPEIGMAPSPNYSFRRAGGTGGPLSVGYSPTGTAIAAGTQDGRVILWDPSSRGIIRSFPTGAGYVWSVAFSPDGRLLASGGDPSVRVWDTSTGAAITNLAGHARDLSSLAFSPDGRRIASGSDDQTVKLWNTSTWQLEATLRGHIKNVSAVAFSRDGQTLVTGSDDGTVKLWNLGIPEEITPVEHPLRKESGRVEHPLPGILYFCLAGDGLTVLTVNEDSTCSIRESITGKETSRFAISARQVTHGAVSNDRRQIAFGSEEGLVTVWDSATGQAMRSFQAHAGTIQGIAYSTDGQTLATAGSEGPGLTGIKAWRPSTGEHVATLGQTNALVMRLSFALDDSNVAIALDNGTAMVWDPLASKTITFANAHSASAYGAVLRSGILVTGAQDAMVKIWEISSGRPLASLSSPVSWFLACAISPNLERVAAVGGDGTVRLWDLRSQQEVAALRGGMAYDLAFTPDGNRLVCVSGSSIVIWHAPTFAELTERDATAVGRIDTAERGKTKPPD
jgi:eukaryotic-like serine/threonine-protein kinase